MLAYPQLCFCIDSHFPILCKEKISTLITVAYNKYGIQIVNDVIPNFGVLYLETSKNIIGRAANNNFETKLLVYF